MKEYDSVRSIDYTIYETATGRIVRSGTAATPNSLNWRLTDGLHAIIGVKRGGHSHRVEFVDGKPTLVERDDPEPMLEPVADLPPKAS